MTQRSHTLRRRTIRTRACSYLEEVRYACFTYSQLSWIIATHTHRLNRSLEMHGPSFTIQRLIPIPKPSTPTGFSALTRTANSKLTQTSAIRRSRPSASGGAYVQAASWPTRPSGSLSLRYWRRSVYPRQRIKKATRSLRRKKTCTGS